MNAAPGHARIKESKSDAALQPALAHLSESGGGGTKRACLAERRRLLPEWRRGSGPKGAGGRPEACRQQGPGAHQQEESGTQPTRPLFMYMHYKTCFHAIGSTNSPFPLDQRDRGRAPPAPKPKLMVPPPLDQISVSPSLPRVSESLQRRSACQVHHCLNRRLSFWRCEVIYCNDSVMKGVSNRDGTLHRPAALAARQAWPAGPQNSTLSLQLPSTVFSGHPSASFLPSDQKPTKASCSPPPAWPLFTQRYAPRSQSNKATRNCRSGPARPAKDSGAQSAC